MRQNRGLISMVFQHHDNQTITEEPNRMKSTLPQATNKLLLCFVVGFMTQIIMHCEYKYEPYTLVFLVHIAAVQGCIHTA